MFDKYITFFYSLTIVSPIYFINNVVNEINLTEYF